MASLCTRGGGVAAPGQVLLNKIFSSTEALAACADVKQSTDLGACPALPCPGPLARPLGPSVARALWPLAGPRRYSACFYRLLLTRAHQCCQFRFCPSRCRHCRFFAPALALFALALALFAPALALFALALALAPCGARLPSGTDACVSSGQTVDQMSNK